MKYFVLLAGYREMLTWDELAPEQQEADMAKFGAFSTACSAGEVGPLGPIGPVTQRVVAPVQSE